MHTSTSMISVSHTHKLIKFDISPFIYSLFFVYIKSTTQKRRRNQNNEVPGDVYVEHTDGRTIGTRDSVEYGRGGDETDRSVKSSGSRKSFKSRVGSFVGSIKSKFSRKKSNNYDDAFDNDSEYENDGGFYM